MNVVLEPAVAPKKSEAKVRINYKLLKKSASFLRAINHPLRQKMLNLIEKEGQINVTKIYVKLRLEQSVASQHLAILREAGFVKAIREGKFIHYVIDTERIQQANELIKAINN